MKKKEFSVVIACTHDFLGEAIAIRGVLEASMCRVHLYHLVQKQGVIDFFAGPLPEHDYIILCCRGLGDTEEETQLIFDVVHQRNNDYDSKSGGERIDFSLTPANLSQYVKNPQGTLICGSTGGFSVWPKAFLAAGYQSYIGLAEGALDADCDSFVLFVTGFFYHLRMHRRNYTDRVFTAQEAVAAAAAMDAHYDCGTKVFRYYESAKN
jgi:hypothetical protein